MVHRRIRHAEHLSPKSYHVVLMLVFFFGFLGFHRFYVGKFISAGIQFAMGCAALWTFYQIYLALLSAQIITALQLTFLVIGLLIWAIVDSILIVLGKFTDVWQRPIRDPAQLKDYKVD